MKCVFMEKNCIYLFSAFSGWSLHLCFGACVAFSNFKTLVCWCRKKNIFKLAQGEYIAPEKIENIYAKCKFIAQCFVYGRQISSIMGLSLHILCKLNLIFVLLGDSLNSSLVAVVSVDRAILKAWAASEGIKVVYSFRNLHL